MYIRLLDTRTISENGHTTRQLLKNRCYDIADTAARDLINKGHAEAIEEGSMWDSMEKIKAASEQIMNDQIGCNHD